MGKKRNPKQGSSERGDSTMEVLLDELEVEANPGPQWPEESTIDRVLGELEQEIQAQPPAGLSSPASSIPPPLPRRSPTPAKAPLPGPPPVPKVAARPPSVKTRDQTGSKSIPPPRPPSGGQPAQTPGRVPNQPPSARGAQGKSLPPPAPRPTQPTDDTLLEDRPSALSSAPAALNHQDALETALPEDPRARAQAWAVELSASSDRQHRARLSFELGRLHEGPLNDPEGAKAHYQRTLDLMPEHLPALRAARRICIRTRDHRAALQLYDTEARITSDSEQKAALLLAKGRLLEDSLGEKRQAREAYATAAQLDRKSPAILKALEQRDQDSQSWMALSRVYEQEANAVVNDPPYRAALLVERARLCEYREQRIDAAIELYESALRLDPGASSALEALERLHHSQGRWRQLISTLEHRVRRAADPNVRALALYRIGRLHAERLGNRIEATTAFERALTERHDDPLLLEELASLYELSDDYQSLVRVLGRLAVAAGSDTARLALYHRVGQLLEERLGKPDEARQAYERGNELDPSHVPTLQALDRIYRGQQDFEALSAIYLSEAESAQEPRRRATALSRGADVLEQELGRRDDAITVHARALTLQPGHAPSVKALTRLYSETKRWRQLLELFEREIDRAKSNERAITYLTKIGALYEDALREPAQAVHAYRRILGIDPKNLGALHSLQRSTESAGRYQELVQALEWEAEQSVDETIIVALLERAAEVLYDRLADREGAIECYRRVLEMDASYGAALSGLGRIYHRAGRWEDLLELNKRELSLRTTNGSRANLLYKMGKLCEERIGRESDAMDWYRQAIGVEPTHGASLHALADRLRARRDWEELTTVLELELKGLTDRSGRARASFRLGELYDEHLHDGERALTSFEAALRADPEHLPAKSALARLRATNGSWRRLADELERESRSVEDEPRRTALLVETAEVWSRALSDPRKAVECLERARVLQPQHLECLLSLERLYRRLDRTEALAQVHADLAAVHTETGTRVAALREEVRVRSRLTAAPEELRPRYEAILALSPTDPFALAALEQLALEGDDRALLIEVDRWLIARDHDPLIAATHHARLAESLELDGDPNALEAYRSALESDDGNIAAIRGLARVAETLGDDEAVVEATRRQAAMAQSPEKAARLWVMAASLSDGDPENALRDYERALELWPDDVHAARGVREGLVDAGQAGRAVDRLARAAGSATSPQRACALWLDIAALQSEKLDNVSGAIGSLRRVLKDTPRHVPTLEHLASLYARQSRWSEAAELLTRVVGLGPASETLQAAHLELAEIWDEHLGDATRALVSLQAVLAISESQPDALVRLSAVYARMGEMDKAIETLGKLVETTDDPAQRVAGLIQLSHHHLGGGNDDEGHGRAFEALCLDGPGSAGSQYHLSLMTSAAQWQSHVDGLRAWLSQLKPDASTVPAELSGQSTSGRTSKERIMDAHLEIARLLREELGRPGQAAEELVKASERAPRNIEIRRARVMALVEAGRAPEGHRELLGLIQKHVSRAQLYRDLYSVLTASGDERGAQRALMPLILLGQASSEEQEEISFYIPRPEAARAQSLLPDILHAVYPTHRLRPMMDLLTLIMPGIMKLYPPDFETYGLSSRQRLSSRSTQPIRKQAEKIASLFGLEEFNLYLHRVRSRGAASELGEPTPILIPANTAELPETQQVFVLARVMVNVAAGVQVLDKLTPRELEILLAAAGRQADRGYGTGLTSEDILQDLNKRLVRSLPRRSRKLLDELAQGYIATPAPEFSRFAEATRTASNRIALLVCDDLLSAMAMLKQTEPDLARLQGKALVSHPLVSRLVRFWVSEEASTLRQQAGLE